MVALRARRCLNLKDCFGQASDCTGEVAVVGIDSSSFTTEEKKAKNIHSVINFSIINIITTTVHNNNNKLLIFFFFVVVVY